MTLLWPIQTLAPRTVDWRLDGRVVSGPPSVTGFSQVANTTGGGFWTCQLTDIPVGPASSIRKVRALEALLDGGVTSIRVPMRDGARAPGGAAEWSASIPHSDGTFFDDGTGYEDGAAEGTVTVAASLRATTLTISLSTGTVEGGEHFSIEHPTAGERLYRIASVDGASITIRPPLREAIPAGTTLNFSTPHCLMRLADPGSLQMALELNRLGRISPVFVEDDIP